MTEEQLKNGQNLLERINRLEKKIKRWEQAEKLVGVKIRIPTDYPCRTEDYEETDTSYLNFEEMKMLVLARMNKRLEQLKQEFESL